LYCQCVFDIINTEMLSSFNICYTRIFIMMLNGVMAIVLRFTLDDDCSTAVNIYATINATVMSSLSIIYLASTNEAYFVVKDNAYEPDEPMVIKIREYLGGHDMNGYRDLLCGMLLCKYIWKHLLVIKIVELLVTLYCFICLFVAYECVLNKLLFALIMNVMIYNSFDAFIVVLTFVIAGELMMETQTNNLEPVGVPPIYGHIVDPPEYDGV